MRKRLLTIFAFLALGAVINVALAWGCAQFINPDKAKPSNEHSGCANNKLEYAHWFVSTIEYPAGQTVVSYWVLPPEKWSVTFGRAPESLLPDWARFAAPEAGDSTLIARRTVLEARGWPVPLMAAVIRTDRRAAEDTTDSTVRETTRRFAIHAGHYPHKPGDTPRAKLLPLRPLWPGFALGVLLYGGVPWLLVVLLSVVRGLSWRWRGRCRACGYDLRGQAPGPHTRCPECGREMRTRVEDDDDDATRQAANMPPGEPHAVPPLTSDF